jgi:hypothetical protein
MSYTLLFVYRSELRAREACDLCDAFFRGYDLIALGVEQLSVLDPEGKEVVTHEDFLQLRDKFLAATDQP